MGVPSGEEPENQNIDSDGKQENMGRSVTPSVTHFVTHFDKLSRKSPFITHFEGLKSIKISQEKS